MTARNAMQRLAEDGLVSREPGRGILAAAPAHRRANRLDDLHPRDGGRSGRVPSSRALTRVIRPSTESEATRLAIARGQPIVELRRFRLADDAPIASRPPS